MSCKGLSWHDSSSFRLNASRILVLIPHKKIESEPFLKNSLTKQSEVHLNCLMSPARVIQQPNRSMLLLTGFVSD